MRLNNMSNTGYFKFVATAALVLIITSILSFFIDHYRIHYLGKGSYGLLLFAAVIALLYYLRGRPIFSYDSDGEALNFRNRHVISFLSRNISDEFPKYKLLKYEVIDAFFLRRLFITISSKKSGKVTLKYDISYLREKDRRDLQRSLRNVIKKNRELMSENTSR